MFNDQWKKKVRKMKELAGNAKFRAPNKNKGAAGLNALAGMLNAHVGAIPPKEQPAPAASRVAAPAATLEPTQKILTPQPPATPLTAGAAPPVTLNKIAFTGRLNSGKDHCAEQAGLKIFSLAEPLYALQKLFFGTDDKTLPGARTFLQTAGQLGRGEISTAYPLSVERANFLALVREQARYLPDDFLVDWPAFGRHADLWLDALLLRVKKHLAENPGARVAVTNARFSNELQRLTAEGFVHRHVMCSATTWADRLKKAGLVADSPACRDMSEKLAAALDADVIRQLSQQKAGLKLAAIWCDERAPAPSSRFFTVQEFVAQFPKI